MFHVKRRSLLTRRALAPRIICPDPALIDTWSLCISALPGATLVPARSQTRPRAEAIWALTKVTAVGHASSAGFAHPDFPSSTGSSYRRSSALVPITHNGDRQYIADDALERSKAATADARTAPAKVRRRWDTPNHRRSISAIDSRADHSENEEYWPMGTAT